MSSVYEAFLYATIGVLAYLAVGTFDGPAGTALAQSGAKCGGCCGNPGSSIECCDGYSATCPCNAAPEEPPCGMIEDSEEDNYCNGAFC